MATRQQIHRAGLSSDYWDRLEPVIASVVGASGGDGALNVASFTPGGDTRQPLTVENFEEALLSAVDAAYSLPKGATVQIPPGVWPMTKQLYLPYPGTDKVVAVRGAGVQLTRLIWANGPVDPVDGPYCVYIDGISNDAGDDFFFGGISDMTIRGDLNLATDCVGLRVRRAVFTRFDSLLVDGFLSADPTLGTALSAFATQDNYFSNCQFATSNIGASLTNIAQGTFVHCLFNNNQETDVELGGSTDFSVVNSLLQSTVDYSIRTLNPNPGNNIVSFIGRGYHEQTATSLIKNYPPDPGTGPDQYVFDGLEANFYSGPLVDLQGPYTSVIMRNMRRSPNSGIWLKLRNVENATLQCSGAPDPLITPGAYDLDDYSRAGLTVESFGRVYTGQYARADSITTLLRPYIGRGDIFDAKRSDLVTLSGTTITALVGGINATPITVTGAPTLKKADALFAGFPAFELTSGNSLDATLAAPLLAGAPLWMFVIFRVPSGGAGGGIRGPALNDAAVTNAISLGLNDALSPLISSQVIAGGTGAQTATGGTPGFDAHAAFVGVAQIARPGGTTTNGKLYADTGTPSSGTFNSTVITTPVDILHFCATTTNVLNITYFAYGDKQLSGGEITQLMDLASARRGWGGGT